MAVSLQANLGEGSTVRRDGDLGARDFRTRSLPDGMGITFTERPQHSADSQSGMYNGLWRALVVVLLLPPHGPVLKASPVAVAFMMTVPFGLAAGRWQCSLSGGVAELTTVRSA